MYSHDIYLEVGVKEEVTRDHVRELVEGNKPEHGGFVYRLHGLWSPTKVAEFELMSWVFWDACISKNYLD